MYPLLDESGNGTNVSFQRNEECVSLTDFIKVNVPYSRSVVNSTLTEGKTATVRDDFVGCWSRERVVELSQSK